MAVVSEGLRPGIRSELIPSPSGFACLDRKINEINAAVTDVELCRLFRKCLPMAAATSVTYFEDDAGKSYTHVGNGDIGLVGSVPSWHRDAVGQFDPYIELINQDDSLRKRVLGLINLQSRYTLRDPYANAYYLEELRPSPHIFDRTAKRLGVHERKWEPDSLAYTVSLAYRYWQETRDISFADGEWAAATKLVYQTFSEQQRLENKGPYYFERLFGKHNERVPGHGWGAPTAKVGLIHATHRPSDDACVLPFHIPDNMFAAQALKQLSEMYREIPKIKDEYFARSCENFSGTILEAVKKYGIVDNPCFGKIFAYEVDGFGNYMKIDDGGSPNLVSLPIESGEVLDIVDPNREVYENTRRFAHSFVNPYFYQGKIAEGIGSSHTGEGRVIPLSIINRALTSDDDEEILFCLDMLKRIHGGRYTMGESVTVNPPLVRSRDKWFPWPDSAFAKLILDLQKRKPHLLQAGS